MRTVNGISSADAAAGNDKLRRYLDGLADAASKPATTPTQTPAPTASAGALAGADGYFTLTLTGETDSSGNTLYYQLQSCTALAFDSANNVTTYGGDSGAAQTKWVLQDPNATKFFRWRSRTDGSAWTDWTYYSSAAACGPITVWAGLLKTSSLALVDSAAETTDGSNALTQHGTATQIDVAAKTWNVGTQQIAYSGGSVDPGSYGTWYVYVVDAKKAGGVVTYLATQNTGDLTHQDGLIVFGHITTAGGGGGTGGGGGSCGVAGSLVDMYDGSQKPVEQVRKGDILLGSDGGQEISQMDTYPVVQPCFRLTFANGIVARGVSSPDRLRLNGGGFVKAFDLVLGDVLLTKQGPSALTVKEFIDLQTVYPLQLSRSFTYWLDGVASHNIKPAP